MSKDNVVKMPEETKVSLTHKPLALVIVKQEFDQDEEQRELLNPMKFIKNEYVDPKTEPEELLLTEDVKLEDEGDAEVEERETEEGSSALGLPQEVIPFSIDERRVINNGAIQTCSICKIGFTDAKILKKHVRSEHGVIQKLTSSTCEICNKTFKTVPKLRKHLQVHTGEKPYACEVCKKCFAQNDNLQVHMRIHTGERPFECQTCSHSFVTKSALKVHLRVHSGERPYQCKVCYKAFATSSYLAVHVRRHSVERPFQCEYCDKCFKIHQQWKRHQKFHLKNKILYYCNKCKTTFGQKISYTIHMKLGCERVKIKKKRKYDKKYSCSYCGKNTASKNGLIRHIRLHTGEKPFACDTCSARYSDRTALVSHKRKHTDDKPYHCAKCDMYFKSPNNLSRHRKKHHPSDVATAAAKPKEQEKELLEESSSSD